MPRASADIIPKFRSNCVDGGILWYSEPSYFSTINLTEDDHRSLLDALGTLKQKIEQEEILQCILLQESNVDDGDEADPDFRLSLNAQREDWNRLRSEIFDLSCCSRFAEQYSKVSENIYSDGILARSLQSMDLVDTPDSIQLARKLEQERLDILFARRLSEGTARGNGDVVPPLAENSSVVNDQLAVLKQVLLLPNDTLTESSLPSRRTSTSTEGSFDAFSYADTKRSNIQLKSSHRLFDLNMQDYRLAGQLADDDSLLGDDTGEEFSTGGHFKLTTPQQGPYAAASLLSGESLAAPQTPEQSPAKSGKSAAAAATAPRRSEAHDALFSTKDKCASCLEIASVARLACAHSMCRNCLSALFRAAIGDRTLLPARCCQQRVPAELAAAILPPDVLARLVQRTREAQARNFMHCPVPACSAFIELDAATLASPTPRLECPACLAAVCVTCRTAWHEGATCDASRAAQETEAVAVLARARGWRRCAGCTVFVSLDHGCNHMTCACGHNFCYACGAAWKTCACALWEEEEQLYAERERVAAEVAEEREVLRRPLVAQEVAAVRQRVRQVFEHEERHGECEHAGRRYVSGRHFGQCARCNWTCNVYGYRCDDCRLVFCQTCHHHRM